MTVESKLYPQIQSFYEALIADLQRGEKQISMAYFTFDDGVWAQKIAEILCERVAAGVEVRLMVDQFGLAGDNAFNVFTNHILMRKMQRAGVQVTKFNSRGKDLSAFNRMHCKFTAIDTNKVFVGGSNIGDYYIDWTDTNIRLVGQLGNTFHELFDYIKAFSKSDGVSSYSRKIVPQFLTDDVRIRLTVPGRCTDVRQAYLDLIHNASKSLHIQTWYFLPDEEILEALCAKALSGVRVNVMLSNRTRVRPIDWANYIHAHKLAKAGGNAYRFTNGYMHSKVAWNDHDEILLGSANLDPHSFYYNFEELIYLKSPKLARNLSDSFNRDLEFSFLQTPDAFNQRSLPKKALSHALNQVSAWLQKPSLKLEGTL